MKRSREIFNAIAIILLVFFSATAYGDTWTKNKRLTWNEGDSEIPTIAVDGSNVYVFWCDNTPGNYEIYFKKSVDEGTTWTKNKRVTWNEGDSHFPATAVEGSNIYVVWQGYTLGNPGIYFKKSVDGGTTWTKGERLTNNASASYAPAIAVVGSNIYVVWYDETPGNDEIYFEKSVDGGDTWTTSKRLTWNTGSSYYPTIAANGSKIYVVWFDDTPGNDEIYFKKSVDEGDTWTTSKRITWDARYSRYPSIAVSASNIYVVWEEQALGYLEIYFKRSVDGGDTWTPGQRLTNTAGASYDPAIAADGLNVYVVWQRSTPLYGLPDIYFKKSYDGGSTWTTNKRLSWNQYPSECASVAVDSSNVYVIWQNLVYPQSNTGYNYEIYFKKGVLD
jgi:hypothetical protein